MLGRWKTNWTHSQYCSLFDKQKWQECTVRSNSIFKHTSQNAVDCRETISAWWTPNSWCNWGWTPVSWSCPAQPLRSFPSCKCCRTRNSPVTVSKPRLRAFWQPASKPRYRPVGKFKLSHFYSPPCIYPCRLLPLELFVLKNCTFAVTKVNRGEIECGNLRWEAILS